MLQPFYRMKTLNLLDNRQKQAIVLGIDPKVD
jgi:hypothetical protein